MAASVQEMRISTAVEIMLLHLENMKVRKEGGKKSANVCIKFVSTIRIGECKKTLFRQGGGRGFRSYCQKVGVIFYSIPY